ncbi:MAG: signal peptidase I [Bdellovibrionales bacterium]|nr:signal peptidase I [Bdellovibrionales bacterium]
MKPSKLNASKIETSLKHLLRDYAEALFYAVLLAFFFRTFIVSAYRIPSTSMMPSLFPGDFIFAYKLPFGIPLPLMEKVKLGGGPLRRGDIAIFPCPNNPDSSCIRRIIGLPGDRLVIRGKRLIVNGEAAQYMKVEGETEILEGFGNYSVALQETLGNSSHKILVGPRRDSENFGPTIVPPGHVFVMSDHRDQGEDSRSWGVVAVRSLEAKLGFIWLSLGWEEQRGSWLPQVRWPRLFQSVD